MNQVNLSSIVEFFDEFTGSSLPNYGENSQRPRHRVGTPESAEFANSNSNQWWSFGLPKVNKS